MALYLSPFLYILEKCLKNLNISVSIISFVDDSLIIAQNKTIDSQLFCSYNVLTKLLNNFGLIIEHSKTEVFYFNRSHGYFNSLQLDLSYIGGPIFCSKESWKYLGFIFDRKLMFYQHIDHYSNKAISSVKYMKLLGNLSWGINPIQKCQLYRCCILPITLYSFQLWFYNKAPFLYHMKILGKMQRRATIWILKAFKTLPTESIKAIARIIPIKFHLQKLIKRSQLWPLSLPSNHLIRSFMYDPFNSSKKFTPHSVNLLMNQQRNIAKGYLIDSNNKVYGIFSFFSSFHLELALGSRLIDNFSDCFSFNLANKKKKDKICFQELNEMVFWSSSSPSTAIIVIDASIKNNITTSISHVHLANRLLIKTVHHAIFVTSMEAELFAIRYSINQACIKENMSKLLLSLIPSMPQRRFLIANHIHIKLTPWPFLANCVISSISTRKTL